jgi:hypothetical protein
VPEIVFFISKRKSSSEEFRTAVSDHKMASQNDFKKSVSDHKMASQNDFKPKPAPKMAEKSHFGGQKTAPWARLKATKNRREKVVKKWSKKRIKKYSK